MLGRFLVVLSQICTLFLLMAVGYGLGRLKLVTEAGTKEMSALLLNCVCPCIILSSFQLDWDAHLLVTMGVGVLAMAGCYGLYILLASLLYRREEADLRACLRFGSIYGNVGFMGLPLIRAVLGGDTVIFAVLAIVVYNFFAFTHGAVLMGGRRAVSFRSILLTPVVLAVGVGLVLMLGRITLPGPVNSALEFMSDLNTPLAMVIIGAQLSRANLLETFREGKLYKAAAVKQIALPLLTALLLRPLRLDAQLYMVVVILAGAPTAGFTSIFAERYHRDVRRSAQLVSLSTLLSAVTLPLVAVLAEALA